jgi:dephospho-CoA kinase
MRLLIGITGHMGSGKSFLADYIVQQYQCKKCRLSGKMRDIATELQLEPTREFLQGIGKFMRDFDDDVWVRYVAEKVQNSSDSIVIDDIRRLNEIEYLRPIGFKFIRINTYEELRKSRIEKREGRLIESDKWKNWIQHMTENQVIDLPVDYEIENNGSKDDLFTDVDEIIVKIKGNDEI